MNANNGGPAFPVVLRGNPTGAEKDLFGNEILPGTKNIYPGMTLRDYFAAKALPIVEPGCQLIGYDFVKSEDFATLATGAYKLADAMLKAREA